MSDQFSEVTSTSWFSRITGALGGIATGLILIVVACGALFWNEGRAVKTERALSEGAGAVVSINATQIDPANDGKLVHITGAGKVLAAPADPLFQNMALPANTIRLMRDVEMYQWKQESHSEKKNKLGGGTETVTTYTYVKEWSSSRNDSSKFKKPGGHENPNFAVAEENVTAGNAAIGAFEFSGATLAGLGATQSLPMSDTEARALQSKLGSSFRVQTTNDALYVGANPASPAVGDLRVTLRASVLGDASVVGVQQGNRLVEYKASNGNTVFLTEAGQKSAAEMFESAQSANTVMTWIIRLVGTLAVFIGFKMAFSIFGVLGDIIPFVGDVFRFATGLAALALTFIIAPLVIGTAWLAYRPVVGISILVLGAALAGAFLYFGKSKAAANKVAAQT